ncbi:hypothetical protein [Streptomyces sp. NL15-2K]|uniref:hypothetical protein n=1 Tax=Streptomyces sp. NL15-2K TaxID=376149 RepID=UPI000FFADE4B|nr:MULTISPECIES: hypothetical protein [Actinomycetes]WKX12069.1 hypothetical protein Q4V64_32965 [Kutzneria buriramensis]GCB46440.1 hypothetical protein SNL152K_3738 [Streptomyces sp. NL15-2K]
MTTNTQERPERATTQVTATAQPESYDPGTRLRSPRGRHRKPRPRKMLLAAGGLAVAAGVLSLVRLTPDTNVQSLSTSEAEPSPDLDTGTDSPANSAAPTGSTPEVSPTATSPGGGTGTTPHRVRSLSPTPYATDAQGRPATVPTTIPDAPNPTATGTAAGPTTARPTTAPRPPASTPTAPRPAPTPPPSRTSPLPAPQPDQPDQSDHPDRPGLCLPLINVCLD